MFKISYGKRVYRQGSKSANCNDYTDLWTVLLRAIREKILAVIV